MRQYLEEDERADCGETRTRRERNRVAAAQIGQRQFRGIAGRTGGGRIGEGHLGSVDDTGFDMHEESFPVSLPLRQPGSVRGRLWRSLRQVS